MTLLIAFEQRRQERAGIALRACRNLLWRTRDHDSSATVATLWTHIDQTIGNLDDIKVVLNHQHRVARIDQALQHIEQLADVLKMKAGRRLVQNIERLTRLTTMKLLGELYALRLTTRERRCLLYTSPSPRD